MSYFLNRAVYSKSQSEALRINIVAVVRANVLSAVAVHLLKNVLCIRTDLAKSI